ncbi:MAG: class I SAM-dependent methyltransferase [Pirellula sp.]
MLDPIETRNQAAYDRMARSGHILASIATQEELRRPLEAIDTSGWLGNSIHGWHVLCLAAGGGRHSVLYHAAGAIVTIIDISQGLLELDQQVIQELKFNVRLIQASMVDMPMLRDGEFDLVIQPVSTCYVSDVAPVFTEISRVLKPDGLYISQHKQPINLQASLHLYAGKYAIETEVGHRATPANGKTPSPLREPNTIEFAHSLESILGGICRSGMIVEDFVEPKHSNPESKVDSIGHRSRFVPPYFRVKARKRSSVRSRPTTLLLPAS